MALINLSYLDLMIDHDLDMKQVMIRMIMEELPAEIEKLRLAIDGKSWQNAHEISHKLKSTLSFVGSPEMTRINSEIMDACKHQNRLDEVPEWFKVLAGYIPGVLLELQQAALSLSSSNT